MAVSFLLGAAPTFPPGSNVGIYRRAQFPGNGPVAGLSPGIVAEQTVTTSAAGVAALTGLLPETNYVAAATVNGVWTWMAFRTDLETSVEADSTIARSVLSYGAKGDGRRVAGVVSNAALAEVTVAGAAFTAADVGKYAMVYNDTEGGTVRTIESVVSSTTVKLSGAAGLTLAAAGFFAYGTDDTAAFTACAAAAQTEGVISNTNFNEPIGLGQAALVVPALPNGGFYFLASQWVVPSGVYVECFGMLANVQASRTAPLVVFTSWTGFSRLYVECLFGAGVQAGQEEKQGAIRGGLLTLWHVGLEELAGVPQRGLHINGTGVLVDTVWMKGGYIGIQHQPGSDITINRAHLIGCKEGIRMNKSNMVHYGAVLLDTCGHTAGTFYGISINEESSQVSFDSIQAFQINGSTRVLAAIFAVGVLPTNKKSNIIRANIVAQRCGGVVVLLENAQDVIINLEASNNTSPSSVGTAALTTAVVFGTVSGNCSIVGALTGSITPYSGVVAGTFHYNRTGARYVVGGGAAPAVAAGAQNGAAPPAPTTATANAQKGTVNFGSGTGPAAGEQVAVTFSDTTGYVAAPVVTVTPLNAATAALGLYVETLTTGFKVGAANAPAASKATGTFAFAYAVAG